MGNGGHGVGLYKAQGIVLRSMRLGEADRIITFYTQSHGRLRAVAKGIRKSKSRFGARLDGFTHVDLMLYKGRSDLDTVTGADIIQRPRRLRQDYPSFCAASAMADAVDRTTPEREGNVRLFLLFKSGLQSLEDGADDPALMAYAFLAKLASIAGLHPTLGICVECGGKPPAAFSYDKGGAVCGPCVTRGDPKVSAALLDTWSSLLEQEWEQLRVRTLDKIVKRDLGAILPGFVQWHTESRFRAFAMLPALAR